MEEKNSFYTLKGYALRQKPTITYAMEDYIEMIYRLTMTGKTPIHMSSLAEALHVSLPSTSRMVSRLTKEGLLLFERYGTISLSEAGRELGEYLLWRHNTLSLFMETLNGSDYQLEQVEKIEHFIDYATLCHMEQWARKKKR